MPLRNYYPENYKLLILTSFLARLTSYSFCYHLLFILDLHFPSSSHMSLNYNLTIGFYSYISYIESIS